MSVVLDPERAADHLSRLFGLAWSLCGSRHLAEELTQETYARVLSRPRRLRGGSELQYLAQTLRNVVSDHRRADRRRPHVAGLAYAEAAETLRIPDGTVMSRLYLDRGVEGGLALGDGEALLVERLADHHAGEVDLP